jgi:hypothetical protein
MIGKTTNASIWGMSESGSYLFGSGVSSRLFRRSLIRFGFKSTT